MAYGKWSNIVCIMDNMLVVVPLGRSATAALPPVNLVIVAFASSLGLLAVSPGVAKPGLLLPALVLFYFFCFLPCCRGVKAKGAVLAAPVSFPYCGCGNSPFPQ